MPARAARFARGANYVTKRARREWLGWTDEQLAEVVRGVPGRRWQLAFRG
jgi:hypothetical protein